MGLSCLCSNRLRTNV